MPRVKLDYVVSFSSEDSENPANNLLANEVSKKKWLCSVGEPSCSVVLQLSRAVKISTVHIGACHAALVEVLVGRSEKPNDQFEVLVPSSVFLSPMDSRRESGVERVRSFSAEQLAPAKEKRWDRMRVVCSQPYNKHCKYGLSFIHIFEPEDKAQTEPEPKLTPAPAVPGRMMALDNFSSDEDDFRPGELFAKHQKRISDGPGSSGNTGAQIRQATSQALKNITDSATKLVKTPITKTSTNRQTQSNQSTNTNRQKETLMYTDDDEQPHAKIDSIVQRHKNEKEEAIKKKEPPKKDKQEVNNSRNFKDFIDSKDEKRKDFNNSNSKEFKDDRGYKNDRRTPAQKKAYDNNYNRDNERTPTTEKADSTNRDRDRKKRVHSDDKPKGLRTGPVSSSPHRLLARVVFALSGYENPRRARLRDAAVALGARFERDWSPACTHLICAFPNTPKLKTVRAAGAPCVAVRGEWLEGCCAQRRLLPWQWFATEPTCRVAPPANIDDDDAASECDTDDEIEKVLRKQKRQRTDKSPSPRLQTSRDKSPRPQTSRERSPKAHTSREISPRPRTSREKSPKPHTSREKLPKPSTTREKLPKPSTTREMSPRPHTSRENSPKPSTSREKSPRPRTSREKSPKTDYSNISSGSDVTFIKDERIQGNITIVDSDNDDTDEEKPTAKEKVDKKCVLPDFFEGYTFVIDDGVEEAGFDKELLGRYVRAYGGVVMDPSCVDSDSDISYVLSAHAGSKPTSGLPVRADWVWRCHEQRELCDITDYVL